MMRALETVERSMSRLARAVALLVGAGQAATVPPEIEVLVTEDGYSPKRIDVRAGEQLRLKFVRKQWIGCTRALLIPALNVERDLPPDQPVVVRLPSLAPGVYPFKCGGGAIHGEIVVGVGAAAATT